MRDITLWTGLKIKMIYISDFYYRSKILYWQQQQNSIVALENWTINQKLKVHFLNPWNFLWVSHAYGHFINGETEAWKLKLLCPLIVSGKAKTGSQVGWLQSLCMFYDLAPKGQELRIDHGWWIPSFVINASHWWKEEAFAVMFYFSGCQTFL